MGAMEFAGDKNTNEETRFRFACPDPECTGKATFHVNWDNPPEFVPSAIPCPYGGKHDSDWIVDRLARVHIPGSVDGGESNPHYDTQRAALEHRWMERQIKATKKAVEADDQITGTAASPYGKWTPNEGNMARDGFLKRDDTATADQKKRTRNERAKRVAEDAADKIDREIERRHIGRRHDG